MPISPNPVPYNEIPETSILNGNESIFLIQDSEFKRIRAGRFYEVLDGYIHLANPNPSNPGSYETTLSGLKSQLENLGAYKPFSIWSGLISTEADTYLNAKILTGVNEYSYEPVYLAGKSVEVIKGADNSFNQYLIIDNRYIHDETVIDSDFFIKIADIKDINDILKNLPTSGAWTPTSPNGNVTQIGTCRWHIINNRIFILGDVTISSPTGNLTSFTIGGLPKAAKYFDFIYATLQVPNTTTFIKINTSNGYSLLNVNATANLHNVRFQFSGSYEF